MTTWDSASSTNLQIFIFCNKTQQLSLLRCILRTYECYHLTFIKQELQKKEETGNPARRCRLSFIQNFECEFKKLSNMDE